MLLRSEEKEFAQLQSVKTSENYPLACDIGKKLGIKNFHISEEVLKPKQRASAPHYHTVKEELVVILSGHGEVQLGDKKFAVSKGDLIFFDPKNDWSHSIVNLESSDLEFLTIASNSPLDRVVYEPEDLYKVPFIQTERLLLNEVRDSDIDSIFSYCSRLKVSEFTTWDSHKTLADSKRLIDYAKSNYRRGLCEPLAIRLKEDPEVLIGTVGWYWNSEKYKSIELAYAISPDYWGRGLVVEACTALVNEAIKSNDIRRITSRCLIENTASARVMEKLGMECEGIQRDLMEIKGQLRSIKNYCILRDDWSKKFGN